MKIDLLVLICEDRHNYQQICGWRSCVCKHSIHKGWSLLVVEDTEIFCTELVMLGIIVHEIRRPHRMENNGSMHYMFSD